MRPPLKFRPLIGGEMQKVDQFQYYRLSSSIHPLTEIKVAKEHATLADIWYQLHVGKAWMNDIYNNRFGPLSVCKPACAKLWQTDLHNSLLCQYAAEGKVAIPRHGP